MIERFHEFVTSSRASEVEISLLFIEEIFFSRQNSNMRYYVMNQFEISYI